MTVLLAIANNIKMPPISANILSAHTIVGLEAEGHVICALQSFCHMGIISVCQHATRRQGCKLTERLFYICQILKVIQVV